MERRACDLCEHAPCGINADIEGGYAPHGGKRLMHLITDGIKTERDKRKARPLPDTPFIPRPAAEGAEQ